MEIDLNRSIKIRFSNGVSKRTAIGSNDVPADIVDGGVARAVCELADQIVSGEVEGGFIVACGCLTVS